MTTLSDKVLLLLLQEWHRQLAEALEYAKAELPDPEPVRVRRWRPGIFAFGPPSEDTPPDRWEWAEVPRTPPALTQIEEVAERIGRDIEQLAGQADD